ncbi:MAG: ribokinase [Gammaproteobacteria bacterium]
MQDVIVVGSFVQDFAFNTPSFPAPGETRIGQFATGPGGKGFNQAVAANRQGARTLFIGACGNDMFGQQARIFAERENLRCGFEIIDRAPSGAASIVINEAAENLIVVALGANDHLAVPHVERFGNEIRGARVLVCQMECALDATLRALALAREASVTTLLNPGPINPDISLEMLKLVDIVVPNETEFAFMSKHLLDVTLPDDYWLADEATLHEYCRAFDLPTVVITLGAHGSFVSHSDDAPRRPGTLPYYSVPPADVSPVDTTGAGDAYCGGLAAAISKHGVASLNVAALAATRVAGLSTETPGTAPAMPSSDAVLKRFGAT